MAWNLLKERCLSKSEGYVAEIIQVSTLQDCAGPLLRITFGRKELAQESLHEFVLTGSMFNSLSPDSTACCSSACRMSLSEKRHKLNIFKTPNLGLRVAKTKKQKHLQLEKLI